eukprot:6762410-Alexandrium_andersonii.AAC.1
MLEGHKKQNKTTLGYDSQPCTNHWRPIVGARLGTAPQWCFVNGASGRNRRPRTTRRLKDALLVQRAPRRWASLVSLSISDDAVWAVRPL